MKKLQKIILNESQIKGYTELYHGTDDENLIENLRRFDTIFASKSKNFANSYGSFMYLLRVDLGNVFDSTKKEFIKKLYDAGFKLRDSWLNKEDDEDHIDYDWVNDYFPTLESVMEYTHLDSNSWNMIESTKGVIRWIFNNYNSIFITEEGDVNYLFYAERIKDIVKIK